MFLMLWYCNSYLPAVTLTRISSRIKQKKLYQKTLTVGVNELKIYIWKFFFCEYNDFALNTNKWQAYVVVVVLNILHLKQQGIS